MVTFEPTEDYSELIPRGEKVRERKKRSGDDYFLIRKRGMIRNTEYRKFMGGKNTVYEYAWSMLVRNKMYNDTYNIKEEYYDKGFLAYASTYNHIAKKCYMDKNTAQKYIEEFENIGAIKIIKIGPKPTKKDKRGRIIDRRVSVFILGTWQKTTNADGEEKIIENYYLDDLFYKQT